MMTGGGAQSTPTSPPMLAYSLQMVMGNSQTILLVGLKAKRKHFNWSGPSALKFANALSTGSQFTAPGHGCITCHLSRRGRALAILNQYSPVTAIGVQLGADNNSLLSFMNTSLDRAVGNIVVMRA